MYQLFAVVLIASVLLVATHGFIITRSNRFVDSRGCGADNNIDRELDLFFETAAEQGSQAVTKMDLKERVTRVKRGAELEDIIFAKRDDILALENSLLNGGKQLREEESQQYTERPLPVSLDDLETTNKLKQLREEFSELKSEYMRVVGGGRKDVPIYFGRVPDSFQ